MAQNTVPPHQQRITHAQDKGKELIYGIFIGISLVVVAIWIGSTLFSDTEGYLTNVFTEVISVIATIFVIDRINQWRDDRRLKNQLLAELKSASTSPAVNALDRLRREGWLDEDYFVGKDLQRANWEGAYIGGLNFEGAMLDKVNFKQITSDDGINSHKVNFKNTRLAAANFEDVRLPFANLENAELRHIHLENSNLLLANLKNANLRLAHLEGTYLEEAYLEGADLEGAHLNGAYLMNTHLKGANLIEAHIDNVRWSRPDGTNPAILPDGTKWTQHENERIERFTNWEHPEFRDTLDKINAIRKEQGYKPIW